jgi:cobalt-zinc-cadmium efflux system outer membrane protein
VSLIVLVLLATPREVTFFDARAQAVQHAPDVVLAQGRVDVAKTEVAVAGGLPNPTLGLTTAVQTAKFGSSLGVPLLLFGQRATAMRAAQADADAAGLDAVTVQREARWVSSLAWIDLWEAQERTRLLELARQDADRLLKIAQEKFDEGSGPRLDVVRTRADRARAVSEADAASRAITAAAARLAADVGLDPSEALTAQGSADFPALIPVLDALAARLGEHPTLARDRAQVSAAERHGDAERRARWPTLTPQVTVNVGDPTLPGTDFIFGLSLDLPVLNQRQGPIAKADAQRRLAEASLEQDERKLRAELVDAYRRAEAAATRLRALRDEVLPSMKEAYQMTDEGFRSGRIDLLHVLDAQRAYLEARLAEVDADATYNRAAADVERAAGADLSGVTHAP